MLKFCFLFLLSLSCSRFVQLTDDSYQDTIDKKSQSDHFKFIFSHNINGETHPCGCRQFPLGGLPQVAGYIHTVKAQVPYLYVDTGDTFFPSVNIPESMQDSIKFTATKLAEAMDELGLKYFLPGDQDFAMGEEFLVNISKKHKFTFLISNLSEKSKIEHKPWTAIKAGDNAIILLGVVAKDTLSADVQPLFIDEKLAIKKTLTKIKKQFSPLAEKTIILLSHSGMQRDKTLAKEFPEIDWIIGAHTQDFLKEPVTEGDTKIVQVLSRNHYLGAISLPYHPKGKTNYELVEMREDWEQKYPNNPMTKWLTKYKTEFDAIQAKEQQNLSTQYADNIKMPTFNSCTDCHQKQVEFWQGTAHAIAFHTLMANKADHNPQCVGCHSVGYKDPNGFVKTEDIIRGDELTDQKVDQYFKELRSVFKGIKSVRELPSSKRRTLAGKWMKLDQKYKVTHDFANVQCLNCHDKAFDHPFEMTETKPQSDYANKCIKCHTTDQSPEWYLKDDKGLATILNKKYVEQKIKEIGCPKRTE